MRTLAKDEAFLDGTSYYRSPSVSDESRSASSYDCWQKTETKVVSSGLNDNVSTAKRFASLLSKPVVIVNAAGAN
jgi:hypothetical protein